MFKNYGKIENGDYVLEETKVGKCFKDIETFRNNPDKVCYVFEEGSRKVGYTRNDILKMTKGDEELCQLVFFLLQGKPVTKVICELVELGIIGTSGKEKR